MFRARIGLAAAAVIALVGAFVANSISSTITRETMKSVELRVERSQQAFPKLDLLRGVELTNEAAKIAREDELAAIFAKGSVDEQRRAAFEAVQVRNARLEQAGRKADLVAVVGANGHVVSRDLNINAMYDDDLKAKYPSVGKALEGIANKDVWTFDGHLYRVGAAPIRSQAGQIVGALVIGYVASAVDATTDRDKMGSEVAYFLDRKVQASSFKKESAEEKGLAQVLFEGPKHADAAAGGEMTKLFHVQLGNEEFVAAAGPLPGNMTRSGSGFVVLSSITQARAPFENIRWFVIVLTAIGVLATLGVSVLTGMRFLMPLDSIERGVAEVINGNHDYTFEAPSAEFEGLANGLNVMMARLLGRPDPTDDDVPAESGGAARAAWSGEMAVDNATGSHPSAENLALASEPEAEYLKRLYSEFIAAKKQAGEGTEGLTFEGFTEKLKQNEAAQIKKYNCRMVRFKVVTKNNQVTLKPVPIA